MIWEYTGGDVEMYPDGVVARVGPAPDDALALRRRADARRGRAVLGSFVRITGVDANGCAPHPADSTPAVVEGGRAAVSVRRRRLARAERAADGGGAAAAVAALERHHRKGDRMCTMALTGPRIRVTTADAEGWVTLDACHGFAGSTVSTT